MLEFLNIKKSVESLSNRVVEIRRDMEKLKQRRDYLLSAPCTQEDMVRVLQQKIDMVAENYPDQLQRSLSGYIQSDKTEKIVLSTHGAGYLLARHQGNFNPSILAESLFFLLNNQIKDGISQAVMKMEWPQNAISLDQLNKELSALDKEINALAEEESSLRDQAYKAGVTINV